MAQKVDVVIIVTKNRFSTVLLRCTFSAGNELNVHAAVSQSFPLFVDFILTASGRRGKVRWTFAGPDSFRPDWILSNILSGFLSENVEYLRTR
jgi:hypothetical protein